MDNRKRPKNRIKEFEEALNGLGQEYYLLKLYVAGATPRSARAIVNLKELCEEHLKDRYELEVIDIYQQPTLAKGEQVIAVPTLIKKLPPPLRRFIGDMSDSKRILLGLDIRKKKAPRAAPVKEVVPEEV